MNKTSKVVWTIVLVIVILLVVYRSPVLATVPLVTIGLSTFASLRLIALISVVPGLGFRVISVTEIFVIVVLFGAAGAFVARKSIYGSLTPASVTPQGE